MEVHEIIAICGAIKIHFKGAARMYSFPYGLAQNRLL
jgi:hypothetical protein